MDWGSGSTACVPGFIMLTFGTTAFVLGLAVALSTSPAVGSFALCGGLWLVSAFSGIRVARSGDATGVERFWAWSLLVLSLMVLAGLAYAAPRSLSVL